MLIKLEYKHPLMITVETVPDEKAAEKAGPVAVQLLAQDELSMCSMVVEVKASDGQFIGVATRNGLSYHNKEEVEADFETINEVQKEAVANLKKDINYTEEMVKRVLGALEEAGFQ